MAVRISVADRYTANLRAEVGLQQRGYMKNFVNVFPMRCHKMHSSIRNASDNAGVDVAGLLNTGLACADLGGAKTFRGILVSIFDEQMEISHSPPHIEVGGPMDDFRQGALDLYLPPMHSGIKRATKKTHARIRFILQYFLNSDLTSDRIIHHCQRGCCPNRSRHETALRFVFDVGSDTTQTSSPVPKDMDRISFFLVMGWHFVNAPWFVPKGDGEIYWNSCANCRFACAHGFFT